MGLLRDSQGRGIDELNPLSTKVEESKAMLPFDHQATLTNTAVTHTSAAVAPSTTNTQSAWQPVPEGMTEFIQNITTDISNGSILTQIVWSEDGGTIIGKTTNTVPGEAQPNRTSKQWFPVGGSFYKTEVWNGHTAPITATANIKFRP